LKLLGSLIATAGLAISMLVFAVPTTATAAPYPGTVGTNCQYAAPRVVRKKRIYKVAYAVTPKAGNGRPSGLAIFRVYKVGKRGKLSYVRGYSNGYTGQNIRYKSLGKFKKRGLYKTQFVFRPNRGSVYKYCATGYRTVRVKKR
jgi:hypothetical protein